MFEELDIALFRLNVCLCIPFSQDIHRDMFPLHHQQSITNLFRKSSNTLSRKNVTCCFCKGVVNFRSALWCNTCAFSIPLFKLLTVIESICLLRMSKGHATYFNQYSFSVLLHDLCFLSYNIYMASDSINTIITCNVDEKYRPCTNTSAPHVWLLYFCF